MPVKSTRVYIFNTIVITLYVLIGLTGCSRSKNEVIPAQNKPFSASLTRADELFAEREDREKLRAAVQLLSITRDPDRRNYEVEWKFAKYSCFLGRALTDDAEREKVFEAGRDAARIASRLEPNKPEGHFWYAANLGELARLYPVTTGLRSVKDIKAAANRVIDIDPGYEGASAFDIIAQVEMSTNLIGGEARNAVEALEKAIAIEPNNSMVRVNLARAYLALNKSAPAREQLHYVLKMDPPKGYLPEHRASLETAKRLLATRF
jgi:tetratricopeptide (TPR) repeat protein